MRVQFDRWPRITEVYEEWWARRLDRPLVHLVVVDPPKVAAKRLGSPPDLEYDRFTGRYHQDTPMADIVDRYDWELASRRYVADGFPAVLPNFGAGVLAALLGCRMISGDETIWFEPTTTIPAPDLALRADMDGSIHQRIAEFYRVAADFWQGQVQLAMTDLGGAMDVIQSFLPGAQLSLELYDRPGEIMRLIQEVHDAWWTYFETYQSLMEDSNRGYTAWTPLLSQTSYYMLQCDFAYMIGPDMFAEFVLPELAESCARLDRPFYHLDGKGQLVHLDSILGIPNLAGVQWIPGAGAPDTSEWPEVYKKIRDVGKHIQLFVNQSDRGVAILDVLADQLGDLRGVALVGTVAAGPEEELAREVLLRHGVPW